MKRCTECRRSFAPAATAPEHQRVCGPACRRKRRAKQGQERRKRQPLDEVRQDERERKRKSRAAARDVAKPQPLATPPPTPAHLPCHEPASLAKSLTSQDKVAQFVADLVHRSLAGLAREAARFARENHAFLGSGAGAPGP
jgi:hypothetical protein